MTVLTQAQPVALTSNPNQTGFALGMSYVTPSGAISATRTIAKAVRLHEDAVRFEAAGNLQEAEARCRVALDILEHEQGAPSADTANVLHTLGEILRRQRKYAEAEACAHRAAVIIEPLLSQMAGPEGTLILVSALVSLGAALRDQGRYAEAQGPLVRAVLLGRSLSTLTEAVITALNEYGVLCKFAGWFENGEIAYRRAFELAVQFHGSNSGTTATILHNLGGLYHASSRFHEAEEHARRGLEMRRTLLGDAHPEVLSDAVAYGAILDALGRWKESRPIYERAISEYSRIFGPEDYTVAAILHNLAGVERAQGNLAKAEELARRAVALKQKILGTQHPDAAFSAMNLGVILLELGREGEARALLRGALAIFERTLAPGHPNLVQCRSLLAPDTRLPAP